MSAGRALAAIRRVTSRLRTKVWSTTFAPKILEGVARFGNATYGALYVFLGVLAMTSALSPRRPPSLAGAFSIIDHLPGGWLLLLAIALGLLALSGWRFMQALLDLNGCGWDARGLLRRAALLLEGVLYAGLGLFATAVSLSRNAGLSAEIKEEVTFATALTARVLGWPLGHWIVGGVGLGAIAIGFGQLAKARRTAFDDIDASGGAMTAIHLVGWIGFVAKGVIFAAAGVLFLIAAWQVEASGVGGMGAALTALAGVPLGGQVLLAISMGLILHGAFSLIKAWLHKPVAPGPEAPAR